MASDTNSLAMRTHHAHAMPMVSGRKIQLGWAKEFPNLGKICGEILKTCRDRSKGYVEVMIDVGSSLLNRPSLKPLKRDAFALGFARFGARYEQLLR